MLKSFQKTRGQSTLEYAVLIVIVIAALISLQVYVKRGVQGRLRSATDDIGDQFAVGNNASFQKNVISHSRTVEESIAGTTSSNTADGFAKETNTTEEVYLPGHKSDDQFTQD